MEIKQRVRVELKAEGDSGAFVATFATLDVIDKDGEVTVKGAFQDGQEVRISAWGHNWGALPVGKGTIHANDTKAWVEGQFFLDTSHGQDTYKTVKSLGTLQEWSYGFSVTEEAMGEFEGQKVRFLKGLDVFEVSPVLLGAGINTGTDAIKEAKVGARNAAADLKIIQGMHDSTTMLGADCAAKSAGAAGRKMMNMGGDDLIIAGSYEALAEAIEEAAGMLLGESQLRDVDVRATFSDHALICLQLNKMDNYGYAYPDGDPTYYDIPYTTSAAGDIVLGAPVEVAIESVVVAKSGASRPAKAEDRASGKAEELVAGFWAQRAALEILELV